MNYNKYRLNDVWRCPHYLEPEGEARGVPNSVDTFKHRLTVFKLTYA